MLILAILIGAATLFFGWTLGPMVLAMAEKAQELPKKIKESAKKSQEEAKKGNDYQLPYIAERVTPEYHDNHTFEGRKQEPFIIFTALALALIFNNSFFWKIVLIIFILFLWKQILSALWEFIKMCWSFMFPAKKVEKKA